ncbi:MAG TPA: phage tail protein [Thermoanaerobaculia bacterium]|nr:phage tail protein [Thermoanaerobaculia bacterium]
MSAYRFATAAQFETCLFDSADRSRAGLRPYAPFAGAAPATPHGSWVATDTAIELYEEETHARLLHVELPGDRIIDIAGNGRHGIFVLVEHDGTAQAVPIDGHGHIGKRISFERIEDATAFVYLRRARRFVVLAEDRLSWFRADGGTAILVRGCIHANDLSSDGESRVFVTGGTFDADGTPIGEEAGATLITPMLQSPDREDARRWLRIEAAGNLPEGSTLEIAYAATDDVKLRDLLNGIAADASLTPGQRIRKLRDESDLWRPPIVFHGPGTSFAAPLFDVHERYLWVAVTLSAAPGSQLPELTTLSVLYPGNTLMEHLPSIYQRAEFEPGNFLRALVGVLETTTQELDGRIASMAAQIHPSTAPDRWLDFLARWLGVPWDDALTLEQKKAIVLHAPELARGRGTRAGLEALLESLIPGTPRRFRVTDPTADFGFAFVGGTLPAMLGGLTRWSAELGSQSILGSMHLPCANQRDDGAWQLAGRIRIDVAASAKERNAWEPWLLALVREMVPLTVRVELRWVSAHALRGDRLDGTLTLEPPPAPELGTGAITGLARLPDGGARLSASGPHIGTRLR